MNGQKHCPKSVFTSKCSSNDIGNCGIFSYDPYDSTCNGVRNKPCEISEKSRKSEIKNMNSTQVKIEKSVRLVVAHLLPV